MKRYLNSSTVKVVGLLLLVVIAVWLFLTYQAYGNWEFALKLRGKKLLAFVVVGVSTSFATISFQTLTQNHFLTPSILGFDSLYILVQTVLFFFFGQGLAQYHQSIFGLNVILMVAVSTALFFWLLRRGEQNLYLLLMVGMILGTFFRSASTFLQVLLDPNEYDKLQGKLFASFGNVDVSLLMIAGLMMTVFILFLWKMSSRLDVLHLGRDQATNLGINVPRFQLMVLISISFLVALSTALVGPITFLGFIVANVTYELIGTYRHRHLFVIGSLLSILLLVGGQFLVEQLFQLRTTLSVVIEFAGGIYFVGKILAERKAE